MKLSMMERQNKVHHVAAKKKISFVLARFWLTDSILYLWLFYANSIGETLGIRKGDYSATSYGTENLFSSSLRGRMELLKYVYFYAQKSIIKAGNSKFHDLIDASRKCITVGTIRLLGHS